MRHLAAALPLLLVPLVLAPAAHAGIGSQSGSADRGTGGTDLGGSPGFAVETVADGLRVPWSVDVAPDGRLFFTERGGDVWIIGADGAVPEAPALSMDGVGSGEGGLLGIALDPGFEENRLVYLYHTYGQLFSTYNKVSRFEESGGRLAGGTTVIDGIPGAHIHDGGRIRFAPDGTLYVATGDAASMRLAQDAGSLAGKILRINPDGSIPADNPVPGSPVFSLGHRNPQGFDWDPATGALVATEHGPSGEAGFGQDEINVVEAGGNYGWPDAVGDGRAPGTIPPAAHSGGETWAPSGASFYGSGAIPEFEGRFLFAALAGRALFAAEIGADGTVHGIERYLSGEYGRLRDVVVDGGTGSVYVLTSNRDGRGIPAEGDDRILALVPAGGGGPPRECGDGHVRVLKMATGEPACVKPGTAAELIKRGWAAPLG